MCAAGDSTTLFRYGSIIESAFRIDENPYDKHICVCVCVCTWRETCARCKVIRKYRKYTAYLCVLMYGIFICIRACEYLIARVSFPYTTFKPVPGAVLSTGLPRVPRRTRHIHTRLGTWRIYTVISFAKVFWRMSFSSIRGGLKSSDERVPYTDDWFRLIVNCRDPIIRVITSRRSVRTYIIIIYNEDEWTFRVYILAVRVDIIAPESHAVVSLGTRIDSNLNIHGRRTII